jgi:hypothetical protein
MNIFLIGCVTVIGATVLVVVYGRDRASKQSLDEIRADYAHRLEAARTKEQRDEIRRGQAMFNASRGIKG